MLTNCIFRIYWPLLMWEDEMDTAFDDDHRRFKHDFQ